MTAIGALTVAATIISITYILFICACIYVIKTDIDARRYRWLRTWGMWASPEVLDRTCDEQLKKQKGQ